VSLLRDRSFLAASQAHFSVDFLNAQRPVLLAVLSGPLGLTNALIGLVTMLYTFAGSLSQPLFGWLSDRLGARRVASWGILWMTVFFGLALLAPGSTPLVLIVVAALGSGAFHPAGTMEATEAGRIRVAGQQATAAATFILFGQVGYSIGPALGGIVVERWGPAGLLVFLPVAIAAMPGVARRFAVPAADRAEASLGDPALPVAPVAWGTILALAGITALRSWSQTNMITFLPKYYSDLGYTPAYYGAMAAMFMGGSALGGVVGGSLADRTGGRAVILWSLVLGAVPLALLPSFATSPWAFVLSAAAGALTGGSNGVTVVLAQRMMPGRLGAASGLVLGYTFASGAVGTWLSGLHADLAGFDVVFLTTAGVTLLAGLLALGLPEPSGRSPELARGREPILPIGESHG
jgi:FSR family fosmidomycin resistance protein-like MFS transporter